MKLRGKRAWLGNLAMLGVALAQLFSCSTDEGASGMSSTGSGTAGGAGKGSTGAGATDSSGGNDGSGGLGAASGNAGNDGSGGEGPISEAGAGGRAGSGGSGNDDGGASGSGGECSTVTETLTASPRKIDLVIAVDTSGTMDEEAEQVQSNLNSLASIVAAEGADLHVALVADASICIPAPLGSGSCNGLDEDLPGYRHVLASVGSTNALDVLVGNYESWSGSLRSDATHAFLVVSDDDSDTSASDFSTALVALDANLNGFSFYAIAASSSPESCIPCSFNCATCTNPCCDKAFVCQPIPANAGSVYADLVEQTGGSFHDLCLQNFNPFFSDIAADLLAQTPCAYSWTGAGEIDPDLASASYTPESSTPVNVTQVADLESCSGDGFFLEPADDPERLVFCPATCAEASAAAHVDLELGCAP